MNLKQLNLKGTGFPNSKKPAVVKPRNRVGCKSCPDDYVIYGLVIHRTALQDRVIIVGFYMYVLLTHDMLPSGPGNWQ